MTIKTGFLLLATSCAFAQSAKPKTPPVVPVEIREKFFKAQSEYQDAAFALRDATSRAQVKNSIMQEQMEKVKAACGAEYVPNLDKDGEIVCTDKPKTPEPPKK